MSREAVLRARRVVVKVGSSLLTRDGALRRAAFGNIASQVEEAATAGREIVLVSSGAIAVGSHTLGWLHPGHSIPEKQAAAAVGQVGLVELYRRRFARHGRNVAQVLLTRAGLQDRERFLNARHTLQTLLELGVVPIVNENDTVSTEEIRFGDNDNLSATVVNLVGAELLVILTDVEGLYSAPPQPGRRKPPLLSVVEEITPEIRDAVGGAGTTFGRGGMSTKLTAAAAAGRGGAATVICDGRRRDTLARVLRGEVVGTFFPTRDRLTSRKHWLAFTTRTRGTLSLDSGAAQALLSGGRSLLPAGIRKVQGAFGMGEVVCCTGPKGEEIARGLSAYSSEAIARIAGHSTGEIAEMLGYSNGDAVIHRDDLVITHEARKP